MTVYKDKLREDDTLTDLCVRLNEPEIILLVRDLITNHSLGDLVEKGYFENDKFSNAHESALKWLYSAPYYIKRIGGTVLNNLFENAILSKDWHLLDIILTITNSNEKGVAQGLIERTVIVHQHLPNMIELKLYLTILNLDARFEKVSANRKWMVNIDLEKKPFLAIVFMSFYKKAKPLKALNFLNKIEKALPDIPEMEIRLVFQNVLKSTIISYFDYYNNTEKEFGRLFIAFEEWLGSVQTQWVRDLVYDVLTLKKNSEIKDEIMKINPDFFNELSYLIEVEYNFDEMVAMATIGQANLSSNVQAFTNDMSLVDDF
jgi:hypothetical protein